MSRRRLEVRIPILDCLGPARVEGFRLAFDKRAKDGSGKANLLPREGEVAGGVLWSIAEESWSILDRFEPGYQRDAHSVLDAEGRSLEAEFYRAPASGRETLPYAWYLAYLIEGAREHNLPASLIADLEGRPSMPDPDPERARHNR